MADNDGFVYRGVFGSIGGGMKVRVKYATAEEMVQNRFLDKLWFAVEKNAEIMKEEERLKKGE